MQLDPVKRILLTDDGVFLKSLHCPENPSWARMQRENGTRNRICSSCERTIINTDGLSDEGLQAFIRADPSACFKVRLDQSNVRVRHV